MQFNDVIGSEAELREMLGYPVVPAVVDKTLSKLDRHCITFIQRSPFVLISSADASGRLDISPRGDAPGFVSVLDEHTLLIPDRPGNPEIGLIFLIPGKRETIRVSGTAQVIRDPELLESLAAQGKVPALAIAVHVEEAFMHCAKCMIRSKLWQPDAWPSLEGLPTLAEAMKDAAAIEFPLPAIEGMITIDETERLY
jgi:PPOX class probable FMN-dependent enzyme